MKNAELFRPTRLIMTFMLTAILAVPYAHAQNAIFHTMDHQNRNIDHLEDYDEYLLSGTMNPPFISGMSNAQGSMGAFLSRIQLEIVDNSLNTNMLKTYCTNDEVAYVQTGRCQTLSVAFQHPYAQQTSDGGFIICGTVSKTTEYTGCTHGAMYNGEGFLLKTDRSGNVQWYKRYLEGLSVRLYSVIEDPASGNFVACGSTNDNYGQTAYALGVDANGNALWSFKTHAYAYYDADREIASAYSEVTTWRDGFLAITGGAGGFYNPQVWTTEGGALLTFIDGWGNMFNNVQLTGDPFGQFVQGYGINDAYDDDVVISGLSGYSLTCGANYGFSASLIKINPLSLSLNFFKQYQGVGTDPSTGTSVTMRGYGGSNICVTGAGGYNHSGTSGGAIYLETDNAGTPIRYAQIPDFTYNGTSIVYNSSQNYPVHSGNTYGATSTGSTYVIRDNYGHDCQPDIPVHPADVNLTPIQNTTEFTLPFVTPEQVTAFDMPWSNSIVCGHLRPEPTQVSPINKTDRIILSPNPADDIIDLQIPQSFTSGTIHVYDATGRIVIADDIVQTTGKMSIDISRLPAGIYMLIAQQGNKKQNNKFIKQ